MTVWDILFQLLIKPIELILELIYGLTKTLTGNSVFSILALSIAVNILLLPFYHRADVIQKEEKELEDRLSYWVRHIKKTFKGNERFLMLDTYYRQNGYKPYYSLKSTIPLLLQVPFFIAAYHFLTHLEELKGLSFWIIKDLGMPDGLLSICGTSANVLPIAMTAINLISATLDTRDRSLKSNLQLYAMAVFFLVVLYDSPAGLVLYWTFNNVFSLFKNLFSLICFPEHFLERVSFGCGAVLFLATGLFYHPAKTKYKVLILLGCLVLMIPKIISIIRKKFPDWQPSGNKPDNVRFFLGGLFLAVLTGLLIPSTVVGSSPAEFVLMPEYSSPLWHVLNAFLLAFGMFVVWMGIFYSLSSDSAKNAISCCVWIFCIIAIVDYMFFGTKIGTLSYELKFDVWTYFTGREIMINNLTIIFLIIILSFIWFRRKELVRPVYSVMILSVTAMAVYNIYGIARQLPNIKRIVQENNAELAHFTLSTEGHNVIVLMLDRAVSTFVPYLMEEDPALLSQFDGFTYYPNTVSFGAHTAMGAPALYGGYEYTPEEMNRRRTESVLSKNDEALKVMPVLFDEEGYKVTVCDPSNAGYNPVPDLSIYSDYPDINAYNTEQGQFRLNLIDEKDQKTYMEDIWKRNFFCFSMMRIVPLYLRSSLYKDGSYYNANERSQIINDISTATGRDLWFVDSYAALHSLPQMTVVENNQKDTFLMMANLTTHNPSLLSEPEYELSAVVDNREYDAEHAVRYAKDGSGIKLENVDQMTHYQINMAAFKKVGAWLDYLKENNVYDNTRIIIAADHGWCLNLYDDLMLGEEKEDDILFYNPLLMIKDFDSKGFSVDESFMTNADVPTIAVSGLIEHPVNPFTGKEIDNKAKYDSDQMIYASHIQEPVDDASEETQYRPSEWYAVSGDIFDVRNWKKAQEH